MLKHGGLSSDIIQCFYEVYNELGRGYLESVYQNALMVRFQERFIPAEKEKKIDVYFHEQIVGKFRADIIVDDRIILEIKAVKAITEEHEAQLLNYLRATRIEVGLILNFGDEPTFDRKVYDNDRKK
ncbi:MAG TPA: GxxExxY protein [Candidatus Cloacimonadota bacterium]|nr:GxxExxY protein [Candidatus Cloacimonadota bacterium]